MTNFEKIKNMSQEELIIFLSENCYPDESVWLLNFTKNYCNNCESEISTAPGFKDIDGELMKCECCYCEIHKDCRFFPGQFKDGCASDQDMLKIWLEAETDV